MRDISRLLFVSTLLFAPVAFGQFTDAGSYSHTTDRIAIGSTTSPVKQLEVTGAAQVSGTVSGGKEFIVTGFGATYGRMLSADYYWLGLSTNARFGNGYWYLDNPQVPGWFVKLDGRPGFDRYAIMRIPTGAGGHVDQKELFSINGTGATVIGAAGGTGLKLTVNGDANFTGSVTGGNIQAHYQDLAEWVPAIGDLDAGSVVVVAENEINSVAASSEPYDSRVAGVISAQPGVILGQPGESKVMVATTGRVKVKVDARQAPIRAGDLLVTSATTGMAMKSEPLKVGGAEIHRPGTLVGKALEPLASGTGEILVLLSLQ